MAIGTGERAADVIAGVAGELDRLPYWWTDIGARTFAEVGWAEAAVGVERRGRHPRRPRRRGRGRRRARRRRAAAAPRGPHAARVLIPRDEHGVRASVAAPRRDPRGGAGARGGDRGRRLAELRPRAARPAGRRRAAPALLRAALPENGSSALGALDDAAQMLDVSIAQPRPRFFAFVGSSGLEIGVLGDLLASCFDANLAVWAGAASEVEDQAVRWVSEFVGYPAAAGAFTSGGTISNVTALAAARERALPGSRRDRHDGHARAPSTARARRTTRSSARRSCSASAPTWCARCAHGRAAPAARRTPSPTRSTPTARRGSRPSPSSPPPARRSPARSTRSTRSPTSATPRGVWLHVDGAYGLPAAIDAVRRAPLRRARARGLGDARRAQVALPAEGMRRRARSPPRGPPRRARARGGLHPARAARPPHGRHHARVLAALPRAQAVARVPRARCRCDPRRGRAEPRPGAPAPRRDLARDPELEALCGEPPLSVVPFRHVPAQGSPTSTSTTRASRRRSRSRATSGSLRHVSTGRSACARASSTTGRRTTTSARWSTPRWRSGRSSRAEVSGRAGEPWGHRCRAWRGAWSRGAASRPSASSSRSCPSCGPTRRGGPRPASPSRACPLHRAPCAGGAGGWWPPASAPPGRRPPCTRAARTG